MNRLLYSKELVFGLARLSFKFLQKSISCSGITIIGVALRHCMSYLLNISYLRYVTVHLSLTNLIYMRKISFWAKNHRLPAIALLVISKLLLAGIAFYIGLSLLDFNIRVPFYVFVIALFVLITAALLYPSKRLTSLSKKQFYIRQKSSDFIIAACFFIVIGTLVNNNFPIPATTTLASTATTTTITPTAEEILASLQYRDKSTLTKKEKRILKDEFKKQLGIYAVAKIKGNKDGAAKALLIVLTIIAALGLLYLVAALACSLSCNGSDVAAVIVGLLGAAAVIWGTVVVIKRISRGPKKKREESSGN